MFKKKKLNNSWCGK